MRKQTAIAWLSVSLLLVQGLGSLSPANAATASQPRHAVTAVPRSALPVRAITHGAEARPA